MVPCGQGLSRADDEDVTRREGRRRHDQLRAVPEDVRLFGRKIEEAADRRSRARSGVLFDRLRAPVKEHEKSRFLPQTEYRGTESRGAHERLDADRMLFTELLQALANPVIRGRRDRRDVEGDRPAFTDHAELCEQITETDERAGNEGALDRAKLPPGSRE